MELPAILFLRLVAPLLLFIFPLPGMLINIWFDVIDFKPFGVASHEEYLYYSVFDKAIDLYVLTIALLFVRKWYEKRARLLAYFFYFYRLIGVLVFFIQRQEWVFILYPNFLETFFIFYLLFRLFEKKQPLFRSNKDYFLLLPLLFPKVLHELTFLADFHPWIAFINKHRNMVLGSSYIVGMISALYYRLWRK